MTVWTFASRRRRLLAILTSVGLLSTLVLTAAPSTAAVTLVADPERNSTSVTGWGWHTSVSPATITSYVNQGNRIIDLEVTSSAPTFSVAYVVNSGTYARSWWWYYGQTSTQVRNLLTANNARPIDIEPYYNGSGLLRFAVVMVANTGAAQKTWAWITGQSATSLGNYATAHGMRPTDIDRYTVSSTTYLSAILIANSGVDAAGWWHYYSRTPAQIAALINSTHARLIDLERVGTNTFDIILQSGGTGNWWWYYDATSTQIANAASQNGARIYRLERYTVGTSTRYAALMINDANSETTRIRNLAAANLAGANWGFYLKKVGGGTVVDLQADRVFEPASMIKIVHALHALRDARAGNIGLTDNVTWYANPSEPARYPSNPNYNASDGTAGDPKDKDVCAYDSSGVLLTGATYSDDLGSVIISQMLKFSDNRTTDALARKYGFAALNATADLVGMTRTELRHRIGCSYNVPPKGPHNDLTLRDAGMLYEKVQNGTLLGTLAYRDKWYEYLGGGTVGSSSSSALANLIRSEGSLAGLTTSQVNSFLSNTRDESKGGGYGLCPDGGAACNPGVSQVSTVGGIVFLPFKGRGGTIVPTPYVYGRFINATINCTFASVSAGTCSYWNSKVTGMATVQTEMFRAIVKQAVATW